MYTVYKYCSIYSITNLYAHTNTEIKTGNWYWMPCNSFAQRSRVESDNDVLACKGQHLLKPWLLSSSTCNPKKYLYVVVTLTGIDEVDWWFGVKINRHLDDPPRVIGTNMSWAASLMGWHYQKHCQDVTCQGPSHQVSSLTLCATKGMMGSLSGSTVFSCHRAAQDKQGTNGMLDMNGYEWIG